jgi:hypothetical protein
MRWLLIFFLSISLFAQLPKPGSAGGGGGGGGSGTIGTASFSATTGATILTLAGGNIFTAVMTPTGNITSIALPVVPSGISHLIFQWTMGATPFTASSAPVGFNSWISPVQVANAVTNAFYDTADGGATWNLVGASSSLAYATLTVTTTPATPGTSATMNCAPVASIGYECVDSGGNVRGTVLNGADINLGTGVVSKTNGVAFTALATTAPGANVTTFLATPSGANFNAMIAAGGVPVNCNATCAKSAAYTTVLGDGGGLIIHAIGDNNARTFTIDSNANVAYPLYTVLTFINSINTVTIAITSDTLTLAGTASTGSRTLAVNGVATAVKVGTTSWIISGPGLT